MPMHDWTRVDAGIYDDFHHEWISETKRTLNRGLLPPDYYALAEQVAAGFGPDVLTLPDQTIAPASNGEWQIKGDIKGDIALCLGETKGAIAICLHVKALCPPFRYVPLFMSPFYYADASSEV
jgi:hypothetical protein